MEKHHHHEVQVTSGGVPVPAIIFLCVLCGCIVVLCIVYQLLKRDMCCNLESNDDEKDVKTKDGYAQLENFYEFDETEGPTTDDDPQSRKSSRRSSRRSSYDLTATSQSGGELGMGDSASNFGSESIDIRISGPDEEALKNVGKLLFEFNYSMANQTFSVSIVKASDIPSKARGGASAIQVRLVLTPPKNQRFKTKVRPANNPVFNETFTFMYVDQLAINQLSLRVRLYGQERYNPARLIGEIILPLRELDLSATKSSDDKQVWKSLNARSLTSADSMFDLSDTASVTSFGSPNLSGSHQSLTGHSSTPELLISLCYTSLTGRLTVEVLKASNLRYLQMQRAPDTYVKIEVISSRGKKIAKSKTTIRRNMTDPEFNESFVFQMSEGDLREVSIVFSVISISKARKKKDVLGWFTMGREATNLDEIDHWEELLEMKEEKSTHYHSLTFQ